MQDTYLQDGKCSVIAVRCWHKYRALEDYLNISNGYLRISADMLIVVEGTELPCHKQILAQHSKVFSDMMEMTSDVGQRAHGNTLEAYAINLEQLRLIADCEFAAVSGDT